MEYFFIANTLSSNHFQILDKAVYISHRANRLGKGMNPIILPSAMSE